MSSSSSEYQATQRFYRSFGEEPIEVLVKGNLQQLVLSSDIERLARSGGLPVGQRPRERARCARVGRTGRAGSWRARRTVKVVFGPGTFINEAANQIDEQLAAETRQAEAQAKQAESSVYRAALARGLRRVAGAHARSAGEQGDARGTSSRAS